MDQSGDTVEPDDTESCPGKSTRITKSWQKIASELITKIKTAGTAF